MATCVMGLLQKNHGHVQYVHALEYVCSPHRCRCLESPAAASCVAQILKHRNFRNCSALTVTDRKHLLPLAVTDLPIWQATPQIHLRRKALSTIHDFVIVVLIRSTTAWNHNPRGQCVHCSGCSAPNGRCVSLQLPEHDTLLVCLQLWLH